MQSEVYEKPDYVGSEDYFHVLGKANFVKFKLQSKLHMLPFKVLASIPRVLSSDST